MVEVGAGGDVGLMQSFKAPNHPGGYPRADPKSFSHKCYLRQVAFEWKLTQETIHLPLGCLQGGHRHHAGTIGITCPIADHPFDARRKPAALEGWTLEVFTAIQKEAGLFCGFLPFFTAGLDP